MSTKLTAEMSGVVPSTCPHRQSYGRRQTVTTLRDAMAAFIADYWYGDISPETVLKDADAYLEAIDNFPEPVRLELAALLNPWRQIEIPKCAGFYWAKWKIAAEGTREGSELTPSDNWEVMQVFVNCVDPTDDEYLMVSVPGVEQAQSLDSFYWGYGPLPAPPSEDSKP